ncbi:selenocysteine-specific elongation factor [Spiroplasma chinense]|uniref:Selenocysteine-specific elongation factor n=1 Tax=Spiroplasma chinense TaxID=216932 RepID=A0A5B9Y2X8_9MOLU|nr:selenocysteine-specific translation elongation factor [Spiroplasma chinense]QEH61404.1 selenocysteine-specific elongation factor [Spiroplasma chinense]
MNKNEKIILAVAGHVDHGKTSLVKNLTGKDTDTLKEEKERNLSINISFAFLERNDATIALIDLPGHDKFIDNMIAGASSVNGTLLVIAADDGIMPQTIEHINILKLLGVKNFLPIITKTDLAGKYEIEELSEQIKKRLTQLNLYFHEPILVSNKNEKDFENCKNKIFEFTKSIKLKVSYNPFRLDIDRTFDLKGIGTVVTGTCKFDKLRLGDEVELLPQKKIFTIKELQSNEKKVEQVSPGQRTAIKISNINWKEINRGDIVCVPNTLMCAKVFSVKLNHINKLDLKVNNEVKIYAGCKTLIAKFKVIGKDYSYCYGQIILNNEWYFNRNETCLIKFSGDNSIDKSISIIRESSPVNKKNREEELADLRVLDEGTTYERTILSIKLDKNKVVDSNKLYCELCIDDFREDKNLITHKDYVIHIKNYNYLSEKVLKKMQAYHLKKPLSPGLNLNSMNAFIDDEIPKEYQPVFFMMMHKVGALKIDRGTFSLKHFEVKLDDEQTRIKNFILKRLKLNNYNVKNIELIKEKIENKKVFNQILKYLVDIKSIVMLDFEHYITNSMYNTMLEKIFQNVNENNVMLKTNFMSIFDLDSEKAQIYLNKFEADKKILVSKNEITIL